MAKEQKAEIKKESPKSRKGLIIGIVSAVVIAGGAVATFFVLNNGGSPEAVALDAITKTIKEPAHKMSGKIELSSSTISDSATANNTKVILELEGENNNLNVTSSATLTVKTTGMSDFVFRFDEVFQNDGTIYIKPSDLTSFVNSIASTYGQYLSAEPLAGIVRDVKNLATKIGSNWWRISLPEVFEALGMENKTFTEEYNCFITTANVLAGESGLNTLADIYKEHQFLNVKKSDKGITSFTGDAYEATINTEKLADFWNKYIASDQVKELNKCTSGEATVETISKGQIPSVSSAVFLDIDKDRNLNGIYLNEGKDNYRVSADLRIEKGSKDLTVEAPSGAKPITDLTNDVVKLAQSIAGLFAAMKTTE